MNTMDLWNKVERTDPSQTKPIDGKSYKGTSPKPYYLIRKATEVFGPCGIGWGFEIIEEKLLDGALIEPGFFERIHMARVRVWYQWNDKRGTVEHVGQTAFSGKRNNGKSYTDEDAPKKSVTDALVKALSMIGFAGDIFMGRYDDSKYVAELREEEREQTKPAPVRPVESVPLSAIAQKIVDDLRDATDLASYKAAALAHEPEYQTLSDEEKDAVTRVSNAVRARLKGKAA